eukprot:gene1238-11327_t
MTLVCKVCEAYKMKDPQTFTKKATISPRNIEIAKKLFKLPNLEYGKLCNVHYAPLLVSLKEWRAKEEQMEEMERDQEKKRESKKLDESKKNSGSKRNESSRHSLNDESNEESEELEEEKPKRVLKRKRDSNGSQDANSMKKMLNEEIQDIQEKIRFYGENIESTNRCTTKTN